MPSPMRGKDTGGRTMPGKDGVTMADLINMNGPL